MAQALVDYGLGKLGLPRLIALIDPRNTASLRTAAKAGLQFEREAEVAKRGVHVYAIRRS